VKVRSRLCRQLRRRSLRARRLRAPALVCLLAVRHGWGRHGDGTDQDLRPDHNVLDKVPLKTLKDDESLGVVPRPSFFY
jgi:hypothetical protein